MSNEKALTIIPRTLDEAKSLAEVMSKSTLLPEALRGKAADVFVSILAGQELGLPPMAALRGVHVVQGKPILSADTMVGVVLGSGMAEYFSCTAETATSVTYETKRRGTPTPQSCTWTVEDAKRAGLLDKDGRGKDGSNWAKYQRAMLRARCKAMLARDVYPDVLAGCYDDDEARAFAPSAPAPRREPEPDPDVIDVDIVESSPPTDDDLLVKLEEATTEPEVRALAPRFNALPKGTEQRRNAHDAYKARLAIVQKAAAEAPTNGAHAS